MIGKKNELIKYLLEQQEEKKFEVKPYFEKRKLNANAYFWVLCDKIAKVINSTKNEVYKKAISEVGIWEDKDYTKDQYKQQVEIWQRMGIGWFCQYHYKREEELVSIRKYYGSSVYDTKSMSILIDYIVQEAKELDIETLTPKELAILKEEWD